jgi:hypothetical protein
VESRGRGVEEAEVGEERGEGGVTQRLKPVLTVERVEGVGDIHTEGNGGGMEGEERGDPVNGSLHATGDTQAKLEARGEEVTEGLAVIDRQSTGAEAWKDLPDSDGADTATRLGEGHQAGSSKERGCPGRRRARQPKEEDGV